MGLSVILRAVVPRPLTHLLFSSSFVLQMETLAMVELLLFLHHLALQVVNVSTILILASLCFCSGIVIVMGRSATVLLASIT